jgi:hypothetical protein
MAAHDIRLRDLDAEIGDVVDERDFDALGRHEREPMPVV